MHVVQVKMSKQKMFVCEKQYAVENVTHLLQYLRCAINTLKKKKIKIMNMFRLNTIF